MNDLLIYSLPTNGLGAAINVAKEIHSEMGIKPDEIRLGTGERISYNWQDVKALEYGEITEEIYISKNTIV